MDKEAAQYTGQQSRAKAKPKGEGSSVPYAAIIQGALQLSEQNQAAYRENQARLGAIRANKSLLSSIQQLQHKEAFGYGLQESQLRYGQKKQLESFKGAREAIALAGRQNKTGAVTAAKQGQAELEQSIVSRGLLGTSTGVGQVQGLQDQTARHLADIDTELAAAMSQLGLAQGSVEQQQAEQLTGFFASKQARESELAMHIAEIQAAIEAAKKKKVKGWKKIARYAGVDPLGLVDPEVSQFGQGSGGFLGSTKG